MIIQNSEFSITHSPAANTQATITKAAGGAAVRNVCRALSFTIANDAGAKSGVIQVNLRDGGTGAGTILKSWRLIVPAGDVRGVALPGCEIPGTANTAMTLETSAAPGASVTADVNFEGYQISS